jgi:hypothetical protein
VDAPNRLRARFGEAEVLHLALPYQLLYRAGYIFDGHVRVDAMLVVQVDGFDPEPPKRALGHLPDVLWPAVEHLLSRGGIEVEAELGGDHHPIAERLERLADDLLVLCAVDLGGVKECHAALDSRPDQRDRLLLVGLRAVAVTQSHRAIADGRHFQIIP